MSKNHAGFMKRALLMLLAGVFSSAAMPLDIYQGPLVAERSLDPNVLYIHDDSGSMTYRYMPAEGPSDTGYSRFYANFVNKQYYNPDITYQPPLKYENGRLISWGNIDRRCRWPVVLNNGFTGTSTSCDQITEPEAAAERDAAKRSANETFNDAMADFFTDGPGGTVFDARVAYDETCMNDRLTSAAAKAWQRGLNATSLGVIENGAISNPLSLTVAPTWGRARTESHVTSSTYCWARNNNDPTGERYLDQSGWEDASAQYMATISAPQLERQAAYQLADSEYNLMRANGGKVTLTATTAVYHDYVPGFNSRIDNRYGYTWDPIVMINGKMKVKVPDVGDGGYTLGEGYTSADWREAPENVPGNYEVYAFKAIPAGTNKVFRVAGTDAWLNGSKATNDTYAVRACPVLFKDTVGSRAYHHDPVVPPVYIHNQYMQAGQEDIPFQGNPHAHCRYSYRTGDVDYRSNYQDYTTIGAFVSSGVVGGNVRARPWCRRYNTHPLSTAMLTSPNQTRGCMTGRHIIGDTTGTGAWTAGQGATGSVSGNPVSHYKKPSGAGNIDQSLEHRVSTFVGNDGELITEDVPRRRTAAEEIRNFANWYSYYRTRTLAAKSGITLAFSNMLNRDDTTQPSSVMRGKVIRLGYDTINKMNTTAGPGQRTNANISVDGRGVVPFLDFAADAKLADGSAHPYAGQKFVADFYMWVSRLPASGDTPLRRALDYAGRYYKTAEPWKEYPRITTGIPGTGQQFGCRRAFTILMTDGYYNNSLGTTVVGDVDKGPGPTIWRTDIDNVELKNSANLNDPRYLKNKYQYKEKTRPFYGANTRADSGIPANASDYHYGNYEVSNSLADIAMYYWYQDLRSDMPNMVTPTKKDPAFWQHMQTFTLGLGVQGRMSADEVNDFLANGSQKNILWTFPTDLDTNYEKVDDLMHAGLNGRGGTAAAEDAGEFAGQLAALLSEISGQAGSATSPATPRDMQTDSMFYEASYDPSDWVGDVVGYETCLKDEALCGKKFAQRIDPAKWSAAELLSQRVLTSTSGHGARNIVTSTVGSGAVAFTTTQLTQDVKSDIDVNSDHPGSPEKCIIPGSGTDCILHRSRSAEATPYSVDHLINYLRGDSSLEDTVNNTTTIATTYNGFRRRSYTDVNGKRQLRLLGDIVNSDPLLITARKDDWEISPRLGYSADSGLMDPNSVAAKYKDRLAASRNADGTVNREETILVGAGDGMLHGFDAKTGQEQFAYIPSAVHPILKKLADPQYSISPIDSLAHSFYVDGATVGADVWDGGKWLTVAVGSTGRSDGGQSYFALDVEEASRFNTRSVLWEFRDSNRLGVPANGKATIALLPDGTNSKFHALFGNGYGSNSGNTGLFVEALFGSGSLFINTGATSDSGKSGLSSPSFITDRDGVAIFAYAGDLEGRLWKFDLEKKVAYQLLQATDPDGIPQPITAAPRVVTGSDFIQVIVGTGIFLEQADVDNTQVQTIYSVRDSCGVATGCTPSLAGRGGTSGGTLARITYETDKFVSSSYTDGSGDTGVIQGWRAKPFDKPLDYTGGIQGFLLDLDRPDMKGLRVVDKSTEKLKNNILVPAMVPSSDPCGSSVAPAFVELDPVNGAPKQSEILKTLEGLNIFRFSDGADAFSTTTTGGLPGFGLSDGTLGGDLTPTPCKEVSIVKTSGDYVSLLSCATKKGRQSWRQLR